MLDTLSVSQMLQHRGTDSVKRHTCFIVPVDTGSAFDVLSRILSEVPGCTVVGKKPELKVRTCCLRALWVGWSVGWLVGWSVDGWTGWLLVAAEGER